MSSPVAVPDDCRYTQEHEWVRLDGALAVVGITAHAQEALGGVTYVELPELGRKVQQGGDLAAVESAKAAADVFAPLGGEVAEVNQALEDHPELVNQDPYGAGWICKLKDADSAGLARLLKSEQYAALLKSEEA